MQYALIMKLALSLAKQAQADHPELPGSEKLGIVLGLLTDIFGEVDVTKYQPAIELVITMAVDVWKAMKAFGFMHKA